MLARTWSVGLAGVTGTPVEVEVDNAQGLPGIALVGLPDAVVRQSLDRVRAALGNVGHALPQRKFTIGLSPAAMPKQGSGFDLAIAVGLLAACQVVPRAGLDDLVFLGELGLDGSVRAVRGVLPAVLAASRTGRSRVVVPRANADEAVLVPGVEVLAVGDLADVLAHLTGRVRLPLHRRRPAAAPPPGPDLSDVVGQVTGRRALEVAAAGGHHLFLSGPPGAGKTMLAERLPGLLPPLDDDLATEVTAIASVAGTLPPGAPLITRPALRGPAPLGDGGQPGRRWLRADPPRRAVPGPRGRAVPGRGPGVPAVGAGHPAPAPGAGERDHPPGLGLGHLPVPFAAGAGREPVPVRLPGR